MARRATEATESAVAPAQSNAPVPEQKEAEAAKCATEPKRTRHKREKSCNAGFYCYIGPNLKKLIQTGTIFRGTREEALAKAAAAIEAQPLVKTLIVSGDALPAARIKVKTPGNVLYANYRTLAGKEGNHG